MQVQFEGWARNHGKKTMLSGALSSAQIVDDPFPMKHGELKAKVLVPAEDMADGIRVCFSTDMRLGGDQLGTIEFSTHELMRMLKACTKDKSFQQFVEMYNDAPKVRAPTQLRVV